MIKTLTDRIRAAIQQRALDDGTHRQLISIEAVERIAMQAGTSTRKVEITALKEDILPDRYLRNLNTLCIADQLKLVESEVCIVGLGGLGGIVTETLARMGIGRFHLIDGDIFEPHNLNRQLLSRIDTIGQAKVDAAVQRVKAINPGIEVVSSQTVLTTENAVHLLDRSNVAVDCLDNIQSRFTLQTATQRLGIPMVTAAIAGMAGHITCVYPEDKGLATIYGEPDQVKVNKGVETHLGCLAPIVNLMASLECAEVVKVLLGKDHTLRNTLLMVDLTDYTFESVSLS